MPPYKEPTFQERAAAASKARERALARLRAKPPADPEMVAQQTAKAHRREAAEAERQTAAKSAREAKQAAKLAQTKQSEEPAKSKPELTDAQRKADRDARYAARKARKSKA